MEMCSGNELLVLGLSRLGGEEAREVAGARRPWRVHERV